MHVSVLLLFLPFPLELSSLLLLYRNGHQQEDPLHILQNLNVISSILNPGELVLIKRRHRSTIIYVVTARRTLGLLLVCSTNWFILISQMQSNYFPLHPSPTHEQDPSIFKPHRLRQKPPPPGRSEPPFPVGNHGLGLGGADSYPSCFRLSTC